MRRRSMGLRQGDGIEGWWRRPRGATNVEYMVMLLLGILVVLGTIQLFGGGLDQQFESATDAFARAMGDDPDEGRPSGQGSDRRAERSQQEREGASGSAGGEEESGGAQSGGVERNGISVQGARSEESSGSVGGVSPFVVVFMILLVLLVGYFLFSEDS